MVKDLPHSTHPSLSLSSKKIGRILLETKEYAIDPLFREKLRVEYLEQYQKGRAERDTSTHKN